MEPCEAEVWAFVRRAEDRGWKTEVDLGCAKGVFIAGLAAVEKGTAFIGIEAQEHRVRSTAKKIQRLDLENALVVQGECFTAVKDWFAPGTIDVFHVSFPDPWPKRRHHARRLVNPAFLEVAFRALKPGGSLRLQTDDQPYFRAMEKAAGIFGAYHPVTWDDGREYPKTEFQGRFEAAGMPIYRLALIKPAEVAAV
jgi:tRNA (guanine-N7-)-methyltransferase